MSARIVELSRVAARRGSGAAEFYPPADPPIAQRFRFWRGASGMRYVHTVYSLIDCPKLVGANYLLVRRDASGQSEVLRVGRAQHDAPSLNLAEIRHRGAQLGANEVHVHFLAESAPQGRAIEFDLRASLFAELSAEPSATAHH